MLQLLRAHLFNRSPLHLESGIVHHNVELAQTARSRRNQRPRIPRVANVPRQAHRLAPRLLDHRRNLARIAVFPRQVAQHHIGAFLRKRNCNGAPDARVAPSHNRHPALQPAQPLVTLFAGIRRRIQLLFTARICLVLLLEWRLRIQLTRIGIAVVAHRDFSYNKEIRTAEAPSVRCRVTPIPLHNPPRQTAKPGIGSNHMPPHTRPPHQQALTPTHLALLALSLLAILLFSIHLSAARTLWYDELAAWNLLTDPSLSHMLQSWNRGADSGGLLFYLLGRPLVLLGHHVLPIRLASALALWLSAVLWVALLRRHLPTTLAAFTVALVLFGNPTLLNYVAEIRFYALLILSFSLAAFAVAHLADARSSWISAFLLALLTNALLVSSHMLGVLYSGVILFTLLVCRFPTRLRLPTLLGTLGSWSLLLTYRQALLANTNKVNWIPLPHPVDLIRYYLHHPTEFRPVNLLLWLVLLAAGIHLLRTHVLRRPSFPTALSLTLLAVPTAVYVMSHLYKPLMAERYLLPYLFGLAYLTGRALWLFLAPRWPALIHRPFVPATLALTLLAVVLTSSLRHQQLRPLSDIAPLLALTPDLPVVIPNDRLFLEARHYQAPLTPHVTYLLPPMTPTEAAAALITTLVRQGYATNVYPASAFLAAHPRFLYLAIPPDTDLYTWTLADTPGLRATPVRTITLRGTPVPLLLIERPTAPPTDTAAMR